MTRTACFALLLGVLAFAGTEARADDVRPASLTLRERQAGRFDVRWQTPMRGAATLRLAPRFPEGAVADAASYDRRVVGNALVETWRVVVDGGLEGRPIAIDGLALSTRTVIVELRLRSGAVHRAVLSATRSSFDVPEPTAFERPRWVDGVQHRLIGGFGDGLGLGHVLFAALLVLAGRRRAWAWAQGAYLVADLMGRWAGAGAVPPAFGHGMLALGGAFAAREFVFGRGRGLTGIAVACGFVHGWTLGGAGPWPETIAHAVGVDGAHLLVGGVALLLAAGLAERAMHVAAWAGGMLAIAAAVVLAVEHPARATEVMMTPLSPMAFVEEAAPGPGGPTTSTEIEGIHVYVDIGVFESRIEVVGRLDAVDRWLSLALDGRKVPVAEQDALLANVRARLSERVRLTRDGASVTPVLRSAGFMERDAQGIYLRTSPVFEVPAEAMVGVVLADATARVPERVEVQVEGLPAEVPLRARTLDPEVSLDVPFSAEDPVISWTNTLESDPLPPIEAVLVHRRPAFVPLLAIGLLL
ncbi:MAG: hypothetical protein ACYTG6_15700, partial [Planctomycetota bacterium]